MTFKIKARWWQQRLKDKGDMYTDDDDDDVMIEEEEEEEIEEEEEGPIFHSPAFPELVSYCQNLIWPIREFSLRRQRRSYSHGLIVMGT